MSLGPAAPILRQLLDGSAAPAPAAALAPIDRALLGGAAADRLGLAFGHGYQAALAALFPSLAGRSASLCATEERGAHPRHIRCALHEGPAGLRLDGVKRFATMAREAERLLLVARAGVDPADPERILLRVVDLPRDRAGLSLRPLPPTPFAPELGHAEVALVDVTVRPEEVLPGDGWTGYLRPFRTIEDVHVHAALAGHLLGLGRAHGWPAALRESLLATALLLRALAAEEPSAPATHLALAGAIAQLRALVDASAPQIGALPVELADRLRRDRPLLEVAGTARARRREQAWARLLPSQAAPR